MFFLVSVKHCRGILFLTLIVISCSANILKSNNFANKLYSVLANTSDSNNVLFSPISIHAILTLLYQGAKGSTAKALGDALGIPNTEIAASAYKELISKITNDKDSSLYFANSIYVEESQPLKSSFRDDAENYFMTTVENINFERSEEAAQNINSWVQRKTKNNIKDVVTAGSIDKESLILINVLYFKGFWLHPFQSLLTKVEKFYTSNTETVNCHMMNIIEHYAYSENKDFDAKILIIPYKKQDMKLIIVLPNSKSGIEQLERKMVDVNLMSFLGIMKETEVEVYLPKFKIEISMDLCDPLKKLGLEPIFSNKAEFSGMVSSAFPLRVSGVFQKAFIAVDECGTEAGVASGVLVRKRRSAATFHCEFKADRPFLFYVIDSTSSIIFFGKLMQPDPIIVHSEL